MVLLLLLLFLLLRPHQAVSQWLVLRTPHGQRGTVGGGGDGWMVGGHLFRDGVVGGGGGTGGTKYTFDR